METLIICIVAFLAALLTFFSGFGLGTLLTPVLILFFPVELAIALTGVVHFLNNIFKLLLVGRKADKAVLIRFGIPAVMAAAVGAWVLINIPDSKPLFSYHLFDHYFQVYPMNFIIAILLILFASIDLMPFSKTIHFDKKKLPLGGILSGFFGGLSGHQGALRSAFLIKAGLSKEAFIGTAVIVSAFVDFTRLSIYASRLTSSGLVDNVTLIICAALSAFTGAFLGNRLLKKITLNFIQAFVAIMLIAISVALGAGFI